MLKYCNTENILDINYGLIVKFWVDTVTHLAMFTSTNFILHFFVEPCDFLS